MIKNFICIILSALILCSCSSGEVKNNLKKSTNFTITEGASKTYRNKAVTGNAASESKTSTERARILSDMVTGMDGIEKASVIISGNAAIVGITTEGELTEQSLSKLKKEIEEKVRISDKGIRIVAVTAAPDLVERIFNLSGDGTENLR